MPIPWAQFRLLFIEDIQREMKRWYPQLLENAFGDASTTTGVDIAFDLSNPRVQDVLDELLTKVMGVADTTIEEMRTLIGNALDQGVSVDAIAQQIRDTGVTRSKARATAISRTETALAYSLGSKLAWSDSGVVDGQEWLTASTDVCPICEPLNNKVVGLDEEFAEGIAHPPAHVSCRCAIAPVVG